MPTILAFPPRTAPSAAIPGDLATLVPQWLQHVAARGGCRNTVLAYQADLARLLAFARRHDITLVQLVSERLLNLWLDDGLLHHAWSRRTAARRLTAVRTFLAWCRGRGYLDHDPAKHVQVSYRVRRVVAPELDALKAVIAAIGRHAPLDLRDRAILMLLLDAALRASEAAGLDEPEPGAAAPRHWVDTTRLQVRVRAKGDADDDAPEVVGIEPQTARAVDAWRAVRHQLAREGERATFVNLRGGRLSRQGLYLMVRARGAAAGLPKLHPHLFRHRRVGDVVEAAGLDVGCAVARHRHKSTTANTYGAHAAEVQRAAVRTLAPLGELA